MVNLESHQLTQTMFKDQLSQFNRIQFNLQTELQRCFEDFQAGRPLQNGGNPEDSLQNEMIASDPRFFAGLDEMVRQHMPEKAYTVYKKESFK